MVQSLQVSLDHLAEFREGVEGDVALPAAQRATQDDVQRPLALVEGAGRYVFADTPDRDAFIEMDKRFHQELARISRNPIYRFIYGSMRIPAGKRMISSPRITKRRAADDPIPEKNHKLPTPRDD